MNRKHKTGEVVAYLLATVAKTLLRPTIAPVIMWTNPRRYADEGPPIPDIHSGDGFISILTAVVYMVVFAALIRGIAFSATDGETVLDSPSAGTDGDKQTADLIPYPTPTPTEVPILVPVEKENNETDLNNDIQNHE